MKNPYKLLTNEVAFVPLFTDYDSAFKNNLFKWKVPSLYLVGIFVVNFLVTALSESS